MYTHKNDLYFRKISTADLFALWDLKQHSWTTTHSTPIINYGDEQSWFDSISPEEIHMIFSKTETENSTELENFNDVGYMNLRVDPVSRVGKISASMFRMARGERLTNYAWEAVTDFSFEMMNLHRIECEVLVLNIPSYKACVAAGYKEEGIKRKSVYKSGNYHDSIVLGMLRTEWQQTPRFQKWQGICNREFKCSRFLQKVTNQVASKVFDNTSTDLTSEMRNSEVRLQERFADPDAAI